MQTTAFCEIDPYCRKVLAKHWPKVLCHDDIRTLDPAKYAGAIDLVCGGYPCQPFSQAGKRKGHEDERHLWPEMLRIIQGVRPRYVIAENVAGHIGLGFDEVAASLEAEGFTVWPFVIPACAVDAPHRRDRLWIVANAWERGREREGGLRDLRKLQERSHRQRPSNHPDKSGKIFPDVAHADEPRSQRRDSGELQERPGECTARTSSASIPDAESDRRGQGRGGRSDPSRQGKSEQPLQDVANTSLTKQQRHPRLGGGQWQHEEIESYGRGRNWKENGEWLPEPHVGMLVNGLSAGLVRFEGRTAKGVENRVQKLKAIGNAIVPQIAEIIGKAIMKYEAPTEAKEQAG